MATSTILSVQIEHQSSLNEAAVVLENNDVEKEDDNKSKFQYDPIETNDIDLKDTLIDTTYTVKHPKIIMLLYTIFILCTIITLIIQFTFDKPNLILYVNICGGILLMIWVVYQFHDQNSFKVIFQKRDLYLPLLFHIMDTSSDLATMYIYYHTWQKKEADGYDDVDASEGGLRAFNAESVYQIFVSAILIMVSYRIISSLIIYLHTKNVKLGVLQFFDLYIYDILLKSWQNGKIKESLTQRYIGELESYFESFPQLIMNLRFILGTTVQDPIVIFSFVLSFISVVNKARKSDERLFKHDGNIIQLVNKWVIHFLYRCFDVWNTALIFVLVWIVFYGHVVIIIIICEFVAAVFIATIYNPDKSLSFNLVPYIVITPIVSSPRYDLLFVFIYKKITSMMGIIMIVSIYSLRADDLLFWFLVSFPLLPDFVISIMYCCEGRKNIRSRCCCNCDLIKQYSSYNSMTYQGIENVEELKDLLLFGYKLHANRSSEVKQCDFINMGNIVSIYQVTMNNIHQTNKEKENKFVNAWKQIDHKQAGNLLHQFCRNTRSDNDIDETLSLIINKLNYDINQKTNNKYSMTPLIIAAIYQHDDIMVKLLVNKYNANVNIQSNNKSVLYYAQKLNRSSGKDEIIKFLSDKIKSTEFEEKDEINEINIKHDDKEK